MGNEFGKISVTRVYHIGLPVNDIKRAEKFMWRFWG
jgi:hypothetical protein